MTGEPLVQRDDDKPESVRKRLTAYDKVCVAQFYFSVVAFVVPSLTLSSFVFVQVTSPLVAWYEKKGVLKTFHGTMSDVIYPDVKEWLESKGF